MSARRAPGGARSPERAAHRGGFTLVELLLVASALLATLLFFSQSMGSAVALTGVNRETGLATDAVRDVLERMQGTEEFLDVFRLYDDDPADDPGGPGTAPGAGFAVAGLDPVDGDADGLVGEIRFPTVPGATGPELHEDVLDEALGMPRDLDGSGAVEAGDKRDVYRLLPVEVTLRWRGRTGERTVQIQTLLADR